MLSPGIGSHQKPQLQEGCLNLVCEGSRSEVVSYGSGSSANSNLQPSSLDDMTLTSVGLSMATTAPVPAEASTRFSSDLRCRHHHFSLCRCAVPFPSQGWCYLSGFLLQGIGRHPPSSFIGHQELLDIVKISILIMDLYGPLCGLLGKMQHLFIEMNSFQVMTLIPSPPTPFIALEQEWAMLKRIWQRSSGYFLHAYLFH